MGQVYLFLFLLLFIGLQGEAKEWKYLLVKGYQGEGMILLFPITHIRMYRRVGSGT